MAETPTNGSERERAQRLERARTAALEAERRGDRNAANEAWRLYRLIRDAGRDPDQLLAEGVGLSLIAAGLSAPE